MERFIGRNFKHEDGTLWKCIGLFGAWLKLVPLGAQDAAPYHITSQFMKFYTELDLH